MTFIFGAYEPRCLKVILPTWKRWRLRKASGDRIDEVRKHGMPLRLPKRDGLIERSGEVIPSKGFRDVFEHGRLRPDTLREPGRWYDPKSVRPLILTFFSSLLLGACALVAGIGDYQIADDDNLTEGGTQPFDPLRDAPSREDEDGGPLAPEDAAPDQAGGGEAGGRSSDAAIDGLGPPTPMQVVCGTAGMVCIPGQSRCCYSGASTTQCLAVTGTNCTGAEVNCDEAADCSNGQVCCLEPDFGGTGLPSIYCRADCSDLTQKARVCKRDLDCPNNEPCRAVSCRGAIVGTCNGRRPTICQ